jgi:hypothetical protein
MVSLLWLAGKLAAAACAENGVRVAEPGARWVVSGFTAKTL